MKDITISVFVFSSSKLSYSDSDIDLFSKISKTIPQTLLELGFNCIMRSPIVDGNQDDMIHACLEDDIIIFDGSLEEDENGSWNSNYAAATSWPMGIDNILVVSRTRLPLNFQALRTNVPELGQEKRDQNNKPCYTFTNDEIVEWIKQELVNMSKPYTLKNDDDSLETIAPRIPVSDKLKMTTEEQSVCSVIDVLKKQSEKIKDSIEYMNLIRKKGAFISYRSHYYSFPYHGKTALDLKKLIKERHNDNNYPVTVYAEGEIAFEFMTEQKRWSVEKFVDKKLRNVDEVWIFETGNEDGYGYYDSWWTCGEIISLMYMKATGVTLPKIFVYKYDHDCQDMVVEEKDDSFIPVLSNDSLRELGIYFANADVPKEMLDNARALRKMNSITQRIHYYFQRGLRRVMHKQLYGVPRNTENFKSYIGSLYSHVFDESFFQNHIVFCPNDQKVSKSFTIKDFENPQFISDFIRINSEIENGIFKDEIENRGYFSISSDDMLRVIKGKKWVCKRHNNKIIRIKEANEPIFYWRTQRVGPNDPIIERNINWIFDK